MLGSHGLFTWGETAEACYGTTLEVINHATDWLEAAPRRRLRRPARRCPPQPAARSPPADAGVRGQIGGEPRSGTSTTAEPCWNSSAPTDIDALAAMGTSCPDHFLRTKIRPLVLDSTRRADLAALTAPARRARRAYRADYAAYYERCKHPDSPAMRDPNPVVYLVPGVGMLTFAKDKPTARIAAEFYATRSTSCAAPRRSRATPACPSRRHSTSSTGSLEEAKLQRMPKPKSLAGRIALVTGGAGGIGPATAARLVAEGACVVLADIDEAALAAASGRSAGADGVAHRRMDVTDEDQVLAAFRARAPSSAASTSWSRTPASPPRPPIEDTTSRSGTATSTSSPPAISWSPARRSGC